jgi:CBS domain-containing protein
MKVQDLMTRVVEVVHPDATIQEAAQRMKDLDVGPLPVCDGSRLVGMLTDRDITVRAAAEGRDVSRTKVREIMTPDVVYCFEEADVKDAADVMKQMQIRRLMVLNSEKRLVGILSLGDLAVGSGDDQLSGETLERISEPSSAKTTT